MKNSIEASRVALDGAFAQIERLMKELRDRIGRAGEAADIVLERAVKLEVRGRVAVAKRTSRR